MTGSPSYPHSDSGYLTNFPTNEAQFTFSREDIQESAAESSDPGTPDVFVSAPSTPCAWTIEQGQVFQRRKRSFSCPTSTSRSQTATGATPAFQRSKSCQDSDIPVRISGEMHRNSATQTTPPDGAYCDGCLRIFADEVSRDNPNLPGTVPVAVVRPQAVRPTIQAIRQIAAQRWRAFQIGRQLGALGDDFNEDYGLDEPQAQQNPIAAANDEILRVAVPVLQFANGAMIGVFAAVPLPPWANELLRMALRFFMPWA